MALYRVQGNGKAPVGLQVGDEVVTGGGTSRILGVNADGSYRSSLSNKYQTIYNYRGSYGTPSAGQTDAAQVRTPGYTPSGAASEAKAALDKMFDDAAKEGIKLWVASGYRSYSHQNSLYNNYVARDGVAAADRYSARPGHSEHQTGLAFDVNRLDISFGESREGKWISENGWKNGFILRYMKETEELTGYMYEPWHIRYLGTDAAKRVYESGLCLEEYLNITSAYAEG